MERHFPGEEACKSHSSFNLQTFCPCLPPPVSPPFLAVLHSLPTWLGAVFAKSSQTGQKWCRAVYSTFSKQGQKSPHGRPQGVTRLSGSLSDLPNSIVAKNWRGTASQTATPFHNSNCFDYVSEKKIKFYVR